MKINAVGNRVNFCGQINFDKEATEAFNSDCCPDVIGSLKRRLAFEKIKDQSISVKGDGTHMFLATLTDKTGAVVRKVANYNVHDAVNSAIDSAIVKNVLDKINLAKKPNKIISFFRKMF